MLVINLAKLRRQFVSQTVVESWNKIPFSLKQAKNVKCFKNKMAAELSVTQWWKERRIRGD